MTTENFLFFPKINQMISHTCRLKDTEKHVDLFLSGISNFQHKFGACLLQTPEAFGPEHFGWLEKFIVHWDSVVPLHIELRHAGWHGNGDVSKRLYSLLEENQIGNVIIDSAGRRDLVHMRLTHRRLIFDSSERTSTAIMPGSMRG